MSDLEHCILIANARMCARRCQGLHCVSKFNCLSGLNVWLFGCN
jgi:hypothetical protein